MAPRTISQIAGEFGLARGANADPFSQQEQSVLGNVQRSLEEIRSQQLESAAARGFARSSFTEGAFARQTEGVVGQVGQQFAQARTQEALREKDFERGIIESQLGADIKTRLFGEQVKGETQLIGARGGQERLTLAQQLAGEERLIGTRAQEETGLIGERGQQRIGEITAQAGVQAALSAQESEQRTTEQRLGFQEQQQASQALATTQAEERRITLADQSRFALEQLQEQQVGREKLAGVTGTEQRLTQAESFAQQGQQLTQQAGIRLNEIQQTFDNDILRLNARFDRIRADLPFELEQKAIFEKDVLIKELEVRRDQKMIDNIIQTTVAFAMSNFNTTVQGAGDLAAGLLNLFNNETQTPTPAPTQ